MDERDWLAERFEEQRSHLRAVAYRMLGSLSEADDAVQESWLRLSRSGQPRVVVGFTIIGGKIVEIEMIADRARLDQLDVTVLDG